LNSSHDIAYLGRLLCLLIVYLNSELTFEIEEEIQPIQRIYT